MPATFRPPHFILVTSPTDCPVQLAPAGIFPEQEEVTFQNSQILYTFTDSTQHRFHHYFFFIQFYPHHLFIPLPHRIFLHRFGINPSYRYLYLISEFFTLLSTYSLWFNFLTPYPFSFYYIFPLSTDKDASWKFT
jgi:hypothetical protein